MLMNLKMIMRPEMSQGQSRSRDNAAGKLPVATADPVSRITSSFQHDFSRIPVTETKGSYRHAEASTDCDATTGQPYTKFRISNRCAEECTEAHEKIHRGDLVTAGACKQRHMEWKAALTASDSIAASELSYNKYEKWLGENQAQLECNAYSASLPCAKRLFDQGNCGAMSMRDQCCGALEAFLKDQNDLHAEFCKAAPGYLTPYPK